MRSDRGFIVHEPYTGYCDPGGQVVYLGRLLVSWGWIASVKEMKKKLHNKALYKIIPAPGSTNLGEVTFVTSQINDQHVLFPGDVLASNDGTLMRVFA